MARPSKEKERVEQILVAYGECVARHGVGGATLERTAEAAGLARPLIRHYVGNREALLQRFVTWFIEQSDAELAELEQQLPQQGKARTLVAWLFDPAFADAGTTRVGEALMLAAADDPELARTMGVWSADFTAWLATILAADVPAADTPLRRCVAAGIAALYFNVESHTMIGAAETVRADSRRAAELLLDALDGADGRP
ncbi:MAG: TetR/AcrR family transcriptional regulator [Pseudomonadota bacterium]